MLKYETLVLGDLETNCYILWSEESKRALIIDPADAGVEISEELQRLGLEPLGILLTHAHFDHMMGALDLKLIYNLPIYGSKDDVAILKSANESASYWLKRKIKQPAIGKVDVDLAKVDGITIDEGDMVTVLRTPGHTPGSVCFYCKNEGWLFSGDTIFDGGVGTTKYKYGDPTGLKTSVKKIVNELPAETEVLPGHGSPTTLEQTARLVI